MMTDVDILVITILDLICERSSLMNIKYISRLIRITQKLKYKRKNNDGKKNKRYKKNVVLCVYVQKKKKNKSSHE